MRKLNKETAIYLLVLIFFSFLIVGYRLAFEINYIGADAFLKQDYGKPFVYRTLIIWIVQWIKSITDIAASRIFILFELMAFFLSGWVFSKYVHTFINSMTIARVLSFSLYFIIIFELILPRYQPLWYPYDAYSLLFFLIGLLLIRKGIYNYWFYILFIIATFNRETTLFLTVILLFTAWGEMPKTKLFKHISAQLFIWITIKIFLARLFSSSPGEIFQNQYISNFRFLTDINYESRLPTMVELFFRPAYLIGNFGFIYLLIIVYWKKIDNSFLRSSTLVLIPFYLVMLYAANIYEYRIFTEMIPIVLMPSLYILVRLLQEKELIK
jgi:hypothetical protein